VLASTYVDASLVKFEDILGFDLSPFLQDFRLQAVTNTDGSFNNTTWKCVIPGLPNVNNSPYLILSRTNRSKSRHRGKAVLIL
jgi:hypothetical protein